LGKFQAYENQTGWPKTSPPPLLLSNDPFTEIRREKFLNGFKTGEQKVAQGKFNAGR
jgi:hypothetical protein